MKRINFNNRELVVAAIDAAEGRASMRCVSYEYVAHRIALAEKALAELLPRSKWRGLKIEVGASFGGHKPGSYKGIPMATRVYLERGADAWFVKEVKRVPARGRAEWQLDGLSAHVDDIISHAQRFRAA